MRATEFEFRYRFLIIVGIFLLSFSLYYVDPRNCVVATIDWVGQFKAPQGAGSIVWIDTSALQGALFAGALLVWLGALIRTWASAYLNADVVHDPTIHLKALVADGPYRHLRNPLYLGVLLWGVGFGLMASRLGFVVLMILLSTYLVRLIRREESDLLETQGESYARYYRTVPSLLPSVRPLMPPAGTRPKWGKSFAGELFIWIYGLAELSFAVTLDLRPLYALCGLGFAVNAIAILLARVRLKPSGA